MHTMPLKTTRGVSNVSDIENAPPREVRTLRLQRHQVAPKGNLADVNPITRPTPGLITRATPVGTMGSCFASRLQDWLIDYGYNFVKTERDPSNPDSFAAQTARFGIVFNTACCRQVFEAALGRFTPAERWWHMPNGCLMDPYRYGVHWTSEDAAERDLRHHAECVREAIRRCEVFIVTPGIAEVWTSRADGSTFAAAPPKEVYNPERHAFGLSTVDENIANLEGMYAAMREINPRIRLILTVSPVPLTATFRPMHWSVGTTVSKATLRVAVDRFCDAHPEVIYFPSYEIVTMLTPDAFEADNVHVRNEHVGRIMTTFMRAHGDLDTPDANQAANQAARAADAPWAWELREAQPRKHPTIEPVFSLRAAYLREAWRRLALQHPQRPIAVFGAGRHTRMLAEIVRDIEGPRVAAVLDDAASPGDTVLTWPVRRPGDVPPDSVAAVITSSDARRPELASRARAWAEAAPAPHRPVVEELYDGLPVGRYATTDLLWWHDTPQRTATSA